MADQSQDRQEQRSGGYGDSSGLEVAGSPGTQPTGATGRDRPVQDAMDADEAHGNRTGGYGGNPSSVEQDADTSGNA